MGCKHLFTCVKIIAPHDNEVKKGRGSSAEKFDLIRVSHNFPEIQVCRHNKSVIIAMRCSSIFIFRHTSELLWSHIEAEAK